MEVAQTLKNVLDRLNETKEALESKIEGDAEERDRLAQEVSDLQARIDKIDNTIKKSTAELEELNGTITETQSGYDKIVEAGQTLMGIVSQSLPKIENINTKLHSADE